MSGTCSWRLSAFGLVLLLAACSSTTPGAGTVEVQLLAFNDLHGNLETPTSGLPLIFPPPAEGPRNTPSGGIARLATLISQRSASHEHSIVVGAGDLIGASPLLSSGFHDEPTIEALTALGLQLSAVGNHEFDEGIAELRRMQHGGCHPVTGCQGPMPFTGAGFNYLAANVIDESTGEPVFPARAIREFAGVRVGFIGLTLEATPSLLIPSARTGLRFLDEADTINQHVSSLRSEGVEAIVVLIHEGGFTEAGPTDCASLSGSITDILPKLDDAVDVVVSGHTHRAYQCTVDGVLLTSAGQYGTQLSDISLMLDRATGDVISASAETLVVATATVEPDAAITALVDSYRTLAAPLMQRAVGIVTAPLTRDHNSAGESVLGDVIADAMLAAAELATGESIDIAFMNPGGVRADIAAAGTVHFSDLFAVQPFGNTLALLTVTGADIEAALRQQFDRAEPMVLQVSDGFSYRWQRQGQTTEFVRGSITINGEPLQTTRRYRIVTNNFVAEGGDGFTAFSAGTDLTPAGGDVEALESYLAARSPFTPPTVNRITLEAPAVR
jgi:5'-nucleotidase